MSTYKSFISNEKAVSFLQNRMTVLNTSESEYFSTLYMVYFNEPRFFEWHRRQVIRSFLFFAFLYLIIDSLLPFKLGFNFKGQVNILIMLEPISGSRIRHFIFVHMLNTWKLWNNCGAQFKIILYIFLDLNIYAKHKSRIKYVAKLNWKSCDMYIYICVCVWERDIYR